MNEIQEATPWEVANCDLSCSAPGHAQRCTCGACMKIYEQRKAIRDREIREIEAQLSGGLVRGRTMSLAFMILFWIVIVALLIDRDFF